MADQNPRPIGCAEALAYINAVAELKRARLTKDEALAMIAGKFADARVFMDESSFRTRLSFQQALVEVAFSSTSEGWVADMQKDFCR